MDLLDACSFHVLSLQAEGRSPATARLYRLYESRFLEFLDQRNIQPDLAALNSINVRTAQEWFRSRPSRPSGTRDGKMAERVFLRTLKLWANFLEAEGVIPESLLTRVKLPRVAKVLRQPFTATEIQALWSASRQTHFPLRDEALLLFLLDTGVRIGEAVTLTLDKLKLDERHAIVGLAGKGRRERLVPLGDQSKRDGGRTVRALRAYLRERPDGRSDRLFVDRRGFSLGANAGSDIIKRIGKIAGVSNTIAHRTRHTFCTWYLTAYPGDELGLRRIVGHLSHEVTADYVHLSASTIADRAGRSSLVEALTAPKPIAPPIQGQPIARAWADAADTTEPAQLPAPPIPKPKVSALLVGLNADERRALLKELLRGVA
jgi:integrase/recombinase XerD